MPLNPPGGGGGAPAAAATVGGVGVPTRPAPLAAIPTPTVPGIPVPRAPEPVRRPSQGQVHPQVAAQLGGKTGGGSGQIGGVPQHKVRLPRPSVHLSGFLERCCSCTCTCSNQLCRMWLMTGSIGRSAYPLRSHSDRSPLAVGAGAGSAAPAAAARDRAVYRQRVEGGRGVGVLPPRSSRVLPLPGAPRDALGEGRGAQAAEDVWERRRRRRGGPRASSGRGGPASARAWPRRGSRWAGRLHKGGGSTGSGAGAGGAAVLGGCQGGSLVAGGCRSLCSGSSPTIWAGLLPLSSSIGATASCVARCTLPLAMIAVRPPLLHDAATGLAAATPACVCVRV